MCNQDSALARCRSACAETEHCELFVLYLTAMVGSCVLCRNLINFETSAPAPTRVYAMEDWARTPPSLPRSDPGKHFSIIGKPTPPPPPAPPPAPPVAPPSPLPSHAEMHIECEFFVGVDFTVAGVGEAGENMDRIATSKELCCELCSMEADCVDFVFEPSSQACVLLPHVPEYRLVKAPNPSTIAGSLTISHVVQHHGDCTFEIGSGYTGGSVGLGHPLPGIPSMSKQGCCDACDRDPACAKFVFEKYSQECQLFASFAEHYFTFGLMSGYVNSRVALTSIPGSVGGAVSGVQLPPSMWVTEMLPPTMPVFVFQTAPPAPAVEAQWVKRLLANVSLAVGAFLLFGVVMCAYLIFASEVGQLLYACTGGKIGQPPGLPRDSQLETVQLVLPEPPPQEGARHAAGWASVTVETCQLAQQKMLYVGGCQSRQQLQDLIWDEFGHILTHSRPKDTVLLCLATDFSQAEAQASQWRIVTEASDMSQVTECQAMKLADKKLVRSLKLAPMPSVQRKRNVAACVDDQRSSERERLVAAPCELAGNPVAPCNDNSGCAAGARLDLAASAALALCGDGGGSLRPPKLNVPPQDGPRVSVGRRVVVHGLTAKGELNGRIGSVVAFDEAKQRYRVCLDATAGASGVTMAFKHANMQELS